MTMLRLFTAILLPDDICDSLCGLTGGVPGARWTHPHDLHLTLRFVGETDEGTAADLDAALTQVEISPFDLTLAGVGIFGGERKPRALWAGVTAGPELSVLQGRVEAAAQRAGLPAETRKFVPHVTLARLNGGGERLGRFLVEHSLFRAAPFPVTGFSLMESRPGGAGPIYRELRRYGADGPGTLWTDEAENG